MPATPARKNKLRSGRGSESSLQRVRSLQKRPKTNGSTTKHTLSQNKNAHADRLPQLLKRLERRNSSAPLAQQAPDARLTGAEAARARDDAARGAREGLEVARVRSCDTHDDDATSPIMVIDARVQPPEADLAERGERALPDDARDALGVVHL